MRNEVVASRPPSFAHERASMNHDIGKEESWLSGADAEGGSQGGRPRGKKRGERYGEWERREKKAKQKDEEEETEEKESSLHSPYQVPSLHCGPE